MTTINLTNAKTAKITRAEAVQYAIDHLNDAPKEVQEVLTKIYQSFTKRPANVTESKTAKENKELAVRMTEYVNTHFDPENLDLVNAKAISENVQGIMTTQKVTAVARYCDGLQTIKVKGRTYYVPADVEVIN